MIYLLDLTPDDNATDLVTCESFPELTTFAAAGDKAQARHHGLSAIEEAIAARIADGQDIPRPASAGMIKKSQGKVVVKLPLMTELKVQLYTLLRQSEGVTRASLARKLGWHREQVDRLFRLDHNSKTDQIEEAFKALDRDIEIKITNNRAA